jgi:Protein of unknown function (DUF3224)
MTDGSSRSTCKFDARGRQCAIDVLAGMNDDVPLQGVAMNTGSRTAGVVACVCVSLGLAVTAAAKQKESATTTRATGTFDVKMTPQPPEDKADGSTLGRMSLDKQFRGDLEGTGKGEMLTAITEMKGSAGYVALERVIGSVKGRRGTFVLQHSATMTRGAPQLSITVVPDSGTGQLVGIAGKMSIVIADGKHSYEFDYTLPD